MTLNAATIDAQVEFMHACIAALEARGRTVAVRTFTLACVCQDLKPSWVLKGSEQHQQEPEVRQSEGGLREKF